MLFSVLHIRLLCANKTSYLLTYLLTLGIDCSVFRVAYTVIILIAPQRAKVAPVFGGEMSVYKV